MNKPTIVLGMAKLGRDRTLQPEDKLALLQHAYFCGIRCFDAAPAYGDAENTLGLFRKRHSDIHVSTKVGETSDGTHRRWSVLSREEVPLSCKRSSSVMTYPGDYAETGNDSLTVLDYFWLHPCLDTECLLARTEVIHAMRTLKLYGAARNIGLSAYTVKAAMDSLNWATAVMVEYNLQNQQMLPVIQRASAEGKHVFIKKPLAGGKIPFSEGRQFLLETPGITHIVVGSTNHDHITEWCNA